MFEGEKAIEIDDSTDPEKTIVKLNIYDPTGDAALVQTDDGLRIMNATTDQMGVVQFAKEDEVLDAAIADSVVSPYDIYNFVNNSTSVKDDLQNLYKDASGNIVNNTVIKAINELATTTVEEFNQVTPTKADVGDINTYRVKTIPEAGVVDQLGSKIHVPKVIFNVDSLLGVIGPKEYQLYYLNKLEGTNFPGLYQYNETSAEWIKVTSGDALIDVETLPTTEIQTTSLYRVKNKDVINGRFALSPTAIANGWVADRTGIHNALVASDISWAAVYTDWSSYYNDEIIDDPDGLIYSVTNESTTRLEYNYALEDGLIYHYYKDEWICLAHEHKAIPDRLIDDLYEID